MLNFTKKVYLDSGNNPVSNEEIKIPSTDTRVYLEHDNVASNTVNVYTGTDNTGNQITDFSVHQDETRNWMYYLKFGATAMSTYGNTFVYCNYTSYGDLVDDLMLNRLELEWERHQTEDPHYPDGTVLTIANTNPTSNTTGVATSIVIKITANKWLDNGQESKLKLYSDSARTVEVTGTVSKTSSKEYSFTPSSTLLSSTMYYPRVLSGLMGADGTSLQQHYDWNFQTI